MGATALGHQRGAVAMEGLQHTLPRQDWLMSLGTTKHQANKSYCDTSCIKTGRSEDQCSHQRSDLTCKRDDGFIRGRTELVDA